MKHPTPNQVQLAAEYVRSKSKGKSRFAIINWDNHSRDHRFFMYDTDTKELALSHYTTHGRLSGGLDRATSFGNVKNCNKSSLGIYRVAETYKGKHGYSARLDGLSPLLNGNARTRAVVLHPSDYAKEEYVKKNGYTGRSLGCPALDPSYSKVIIDSLKDGGIIFTIFNGKLIDIEK